MLLELMKKFVNKHPILIKEGWTIKERKNIVIYLALVCICMLTLQSNTVHAANAFPTHNMYEAGQDSGYTLDSKNSVESFSFGANSIGVLTIDGNVNYQETYDGFEAYGANGNVTFKYKYSGNYNSDTKTNWNVISDDSKKVAGIDIGKKINKGIVLVQKSTNGSNWENATEPITDYFDAATKGDGIVYSTTDEEIKSGTYYRIIVAYSMKIKTGTNDGWWFFDSDIYETKEFVEEYKFYICSNQNHVLIMDSTTRASLSSGQTAQKGFYIDKNGSLASVSVNKVGESAKTAYTYDSFTEPGEYKITVTTKLGKVYNQTIKVNTGLSSMDLTPDVYECKKDKGFVDGVLVSSNSTCGIKSLTSLEIGQNAGYTSTKSVYNGYDAYGINGDAVSIFMTLNYGTDLLGNNGWKVVSNDWGKKEKEKIAGVQTGEMGTGALIIQTSSTGKDGEWENVDKEKYSSGLYTTDYANHYDRNEPVFIYSPDGDDVLNGVFVRVIYAYQVYNKSEKQSIDYLEKYEFYLCSNELGAVTFHNETIKESVEDIIGDEDENIIQIYKQAETLVSGSGTFSGFQVDTSKNPTVKYTIKRNGSVIPLSTDGRYTLTGRYDIELKSVVGDKQTVTIYVDRTSSEEAIANYFGDNFIAGKRVYAEGEYPVYEGGEATTYNLLEVSSEYLPIKGQICNLDTGSVIEIEESRDTRSGSLTEAGRYVAIFTTGISVGDVRTFTFNFSIIPEGTAPGPVLNQKELSEYVKTNITDAYPVGYAITYQSASKGYITIVFQNKEDAIDYAYSYEKGMVEQQSDGTYRYNGSLSIQQKEKYESAWDLTDAMYFFAEQAVRKYYFDLSDEYTFRTLSDEVIANTPNLRTLELERSVVIFADGQKELMASHEELPIISEKPYLYLNPGVNGTDDPLNYYDFEFTRDKYGCDSDSVIITDSKGNTYNIEYGKGVGLQLREAGCESGIVTITETTIFGDRASYEAVYIAKDDNTAQVEILYYDEGIKKTMVLSSADAGKTIEADVFSVESVMDELDPLTLIIISKDGKVESFYAGDQVMKEAWSEAGEYSVKIVNRIGAAFSFNVNVRESEYSVIAFAGDGTEEVKDIITSYGEKNVVLPEIDRFGYDFVGYQDQNGQMYSGQMDVNFKTIVTLTAVWEPKVVDFIVKDSNGNILDTWKVKYGSEVELVVPVLEAGQEFVEWQRNGTTVSNTSITVDTEDTLVMTCLLSGTGAPIDTENKTEQTNDDSETENSENKSIVVILIFVVITVLVLIICIGKRKGMLERTTEETNDDCSKN